MITEAAVLTAAGWISLAFTDVLFFAALRLRRKAVRVLCGVLAIPFLIVGCALFWYTHRPLPPEMDAALFPGIHYIRDVRNTPRPLIIHVVRIDLDAPGIHFFVTPGGEDIPARTVSQFVEEFNLQLAINGDFFDPWRDYFPWDYYPHVGDPVDTRGITASEGVVFTEGYASSHGAAYDTVYITENNVVTFNIPHGEIYNAISGLPFLLIEGNNLVEEEAGTYYTGLHPRTAVGLDQAGRTLILLLVDGRQPGYSEGVSLSELTALLVEYGAYHAINLDGGGSTTLAWRAPDGSAQVLNSPIHNRIPGRERPIANHLGIFAGS